MTECTVLTQPMKNLWHLPWVQYPILSKWLNLVTLFQSFKPRSNTSSYENKERAEYCWIKQ